MYDKDIEFSHRIRSMKVQEVYRIALTYCLNSGIWNDDLPRQRIASRELDKLCGIKAKQEVAKTSRAVRHNEQLVKALQ